MRKIRCFTLLMLGILTFGILTLGISVRADSMTFQFDRTKTGVTEFVESYVRFSVHGKQVATLLPPLFYLVTESSEKETVVIAKVGPISKNEALSSALSDLTGQTPLQVKGPHGQMIFYNPAPGNMKLSAYTEWKEWLFLAGNPDALSNILKGAATPQAVVAPDPVFASDGLPKSAAIRFWANNANGNFTALIRENQQRSIVPILKDPDAVGRFSGIFRLGPGRKIATVATAVPAKPRQRVALKKDLQITMESSRHLLEIFKVASTGSIAEKGKNLHLKMTIDDYLFGQPGLFKGGQSPLSNALL